MYFFMSMINNIIPVSIALNKAYKNWTQLLKMKLYDHCY